MSCTGKSDELTARLDRLWQSVARLEETIGAFKQFYGMPTSKLLFDLPVDIDYFFLRIVRDAFTDSLILQITSLLDNRKRTLSVRKFVERMKKTRVDDKPRWSPPIIDNLFGRIKKMDQQAASITEARDNLIAHTNDAVATKKHELADVTFKMAEEISTELVNFVSKLHELVHGRAPDPLPASTEGKDAIEYLQECAELRAIDYRAAVRRLSTR